MHFDICRSFLFWGSIYESAAGMKTQPFLHRIFLHCIRAQLRDAARLFSLYMSIEAEIAMRHTVMSSNIYPLYIQEIISNTLSSTHRFVSSLSDSGRAPRSPARHGGRTR